MPQTAKRFESTPWRSDDILSVLEDLARLRGEMAGETRRHAKLLESVHPNYAKSARNLLHYLAMRRHDLRALQTRLAGLGLSSLGRAESHVLATVDAVLAVAHRLAGRDWQPEHAEDEVIDLQSGEELLGRHTLELLGPAAPGRSVRIMVTMPSEAADDYTLIHDLLRAGMECMRINCAHDGPDAWLRMIGHLRRAEDALGRTCRVAMDLAGPKLRTGPLEEGAHVVRVRPKRDVFGRPATPARVWLTPAEGPKPPPTAADAILPVKDDWLRNVTVGGSIKFIDTRGSHRTMVVADARPEGCWAEANDTSYLVPGMELRFTGTGDDDETIIGTVADLLPVEGGITLMPGDQLILRNDCEPGREATRDSAGRVLTPAMIGCTLPEVFEDIRPGDPIWFDDGKIGGVVEQLAGGRVVVRITHTRLAGSKLRADKGINVPESPLRLSALTEKDIEDLKFVCRHADIVAMSFANSAADVEAVQHEIIACGERRPALVLKVETQRGFQNLPDMLLAAMKWPSCGVMIARGDLAVECGFERLAEVQEEILWISEAAHVPVIWATQVLETLAKEGIPSRAEITDAAMGHRAECVMLNKGPHVLDAVRTLDDILRRMQTHQAKKRSMLRELQLAHAPLMDGVK